jgi:hypothetical protein
VPDAWQVFCARGLVGELDADLERIRAAAEQGGRTIKHPEAAQRTAGLSAWPGNSSSTAVPTPPQGRPATTCRHLARHQGGCRRFLQRRNTNGVADGNQCAALGQALIGVDELMAAHQVDHAIDRGMQVGGTV